MRRWQCCGRRGVTVGPGSRGGNGRPPISSASSPGTRTSPRRWFTFNNHLFHSTLSKRDRELVTVRIGWLRRGEYEWAQHVRMAKSAGLSDEEVDAIMAGPDSPVWGPRDAALLRSVDEIAADRYVSDQTWKRLAEDFDRQQLMDLVFTIGAYDLMAMAFNTFGLELDPGLTGFPPRTRTTDGLAHQPEERPHVRHEQVRHLHRREVPAAGKLAPVHDVEEPLGVRPQ